MSDLMVEKYRLKATIAKSEGNVQRNWEKLRASFTFSNLVELLAEQLFPRNYSQVKSRVSRFSGLWNGIISALLDRLFQRLHRRKR